MGQRYLPYEPYQQMLLPHALQDWLPEGHLAYLIGDTVDELDLSAFHCRYPGSDARDQPFHPAMMAKVLIYGCLTGVPGSRSIARKLHEDIAFRVLAAGNFPPRAALTEFRGLHGKELADLFVLVLRIAREIGLPRMGDIVLQGRSAAFHDRREPAGSRESIPATDGRLRSQVVALLRKADAADKAERNGPEPHATTMSVRRADRLKAIGEARGRLDEQRENRGTGATALDVRRTGSSKRIGPPSPSSAVALQDKGTSDAEKPA